MSITHPEPEVRQLAQAMLDDDHVEQIVLTVCRSRGCATIAALFALDSDALFLLHEEMMLMLGQLAPEADDFEACDLALPDPDTFGFGEAHAIPMEEI